MYSKAELPSIGRDEIALEVAKQKPTRRDESCLPTGQKFITLQDVKTTP
jgi:hypothetical protein